MHNAALVGGLHGQGQGAHQLGGLPGVLGLALEPAFEGAAAAELQGEVGPALLLACLPGEAHDVGLIVFGVLASRRGWRVTLLGADTPIDTIEASIRRIQPSLTVLLATRPSLTWRIWVIWAVCAVFQQSAWLWCAAVQVCKTDPNPASFPPMVIVTKSVVGCRAEI